MKPLTTKSSTLTRNTPSSSTKKYGMVPWHANAFKNSHKYTILTNSDTESDINTQNFTKINNDNITYNNKDDKTQNITKNNDDMKATNITKNYDDIIEVTTHDYSVIPLELMSTTEDSLVSIVDSTTDEDLAVIPLASTYTFSGKKLVTIDVSTDNIITQLNHTTEGVRTERNTDSTETTTANYSTSTIVPDFNTQEYSKDENVTESPQIQISTNVKNQTEKLNDSIYINNKTESNRSTESKEEVPIFTKLDIENEEDVPEDYYDAKDIVPTSAPKTDAISVLFGLAGSVVESVVESVAEKVVPKSIYDLFKRMQRQSEALEAERLRSREENGGLGQFGRGILKTISTGLSKPINQLMTTAKEAGSLDTDRGFVNSVATSVTSVANVANSVVDAFKDKVQAIYPGTIWCGDGHSANARSSSELGLFFFTDTCCRQHDACKIYIKAGETKYGLTNTGLFTRSHCSCDSQFRECLRKTSSLVSAQIGLTYFNVLGPQCFRKAHPIVKCLRRTRITGQKCEEYELDYTKPKMWQWFDNETF